MTTVGTNTWGVILSSGNTSDVPSGDICYFFCNDVKRKLTIKDKPSHAANQTSWAVVLKDMFYSVQVNQAIVVGNALATLNSYHALMKNWIESATAIYVFLKGSDGDYAEFDINGTTDDWLKCRIVGDIEDGLTNGKKTMTFKVEECS
jgi:hypothetical protein